MDCRSRGGYPTTRGLARELLARQAGSLLQDYVSAVTLALREAGATQVRQSVAERSYLDASLRFHCASTWAPTDRYRAPAPGAGWSGIEPRTDRGDQTTAVGESLRPLTGQEKADQQWARLEWAEDIGWSLIHPAFALQPSGWRFLCAALVPAPEQVVAFVRDTVINPDSASRLPVRFRHRSQPLRMVIDQLASCVTDPMRAARCPPGDADLAGRGAVPMIGRGVEAPALQRNRNRHRNREPARAVRAARPADLVTAARAGPSCPALSVSR